MPIRIADSLPKLTWGAFFATIVLIPFRLRLLTIARPLPPLWEDYTDLLLYASDVTLLVMLGAWGLQLVGPFAAPRNALSHERKKLETGPKFITLPLLGFTLVGFLTSFTSIDPALSFYHAARLAILFGFYLFVINNVSSIRQLIAPLGVMLLVQSSVAIIQAQTQRSVGLQWLGEYALDPAWRGVSVVWSESMRSLRAYGFASHPNILAGSLVLALLVVSGRLLFVNFVVLAVGMLALFFTYSRSAWLGFFVGLLFLFYHSLVRKKQEALRRVGALAAMFALSLPFIWTNKELVGIRLDAEIAFQEIELEVGSAGGRRVLASAANSIFEDNAILGVGLGTAPQAMLDAFPMFPVPYAPAHNVLLNAALETGILGALFIFGLLLAPWIALFLKRGTGVPSELIVASSALLALTVIGWIDVYPLLAGTGILLQYLGFGMWTRCYSDFVGKTKR
jgi:O-antigen ligase